jgi:hypothetical protein
MCTRAHLQQDCTHSPMYLLYMYGSPNLYLANRGEQFAYSEERGMSCHIAHLTSCRISHPKLHPRRRFELRAAAVKTKTNKPNRGGEGPSRESGAVPSG